MKYAVYTEVGKKKGTPGPGRYVDPDCWTTGPDPVRHDKYYAYLKHQAQAKYRKEDYSLTWEEWENLWTNDLWFKRGRTIDSLCLQQIDPELGWHANNVEIVTRKKHFADIKERNRLAKQ